MKAIRVHAWSDPPTLGIEEIPVPEPEAGEIRVAVHTASVNFGDALVAMGRYQVKPMLPFTPGAECSGIVEALGPNVTEFQIGDEVAGTGFVGRARITRRILGSFAEKTVAPADNFARIPKGMSLEDAGFFRSANETAHYGLDRAGLKQGETLLVLGAGSGTGFAAVVIGKLLGACVIASASTPEKRRIAMQAGADFAIARDDPDWRSKIDEITYGLGVDVVYDPIGGSATERAFRALAIRGRLVVIGFADGSIPSLPVNLALLKNASLIGANHSVAQETEPERVRQSARVLARWYEDGKIALQPVARRYALEETGAAMAAVLGGEIAGRAVVRIG
jgi:NADPH2:quinone reductase